MCAYATLRQQNLDTNLFHQTHNQRMRLYMANVILTQATLLLTTADHMTPTQIDTRKRNASAAGGMDTEDNA